MNAMTPSVLPCPNCRAPIELCTAQWCHCLSKELTVICPSCGQCFCSLRNYPRLDDWNLALTEMRQREIEEKFRRAMESASAGASPAAPLILIVDDDEEIRLIAEYTIEEMGYRTMTAASAEEALNLVEKCKPDVVLTDALMPKVDGRQLCHLIKMASPGTKVVVMSAVYTKSPYRWEAMKKFQADEYLAKPIDFQRLRDVLRRLLARAA